jgi:hypothetical protein
LKYPIVILLIIAIFAQTFHKPLQWADYKINLETYKRNCINKERPAMHCNGQCQLLKKWQQKKTSSQEEIPPKPDTRDYLFFSAHFTRTNLLAETCIMHQQAFYINPVTQVFIAGVFRPPSAGM